jgi:hypothetical protein
MFTLKKREDKKEEAAYVTRFACFLLTLSRRLMDHGFTAQKEGCHNPRQHSRLAVSPLHLN